MSRPFDGLSLKLYIETGVGGSTPSGSLTLQDVITSSSGRLREQSTADGNILIGSERIHLSQVRDRTLPCLGTVESSFVLWQCPRLQLSGKKPTKQH